jgi:glycosyltransferase involved in cell wall biosynthesis
MNKLTAVIITYNEAANIEKCLQSVKEIVDEIIVVDSYSTDNTKEICNRFGNVTFIEHPFENFGRQKQFAIEQSNNDWVISLDADEQLSLELAEEIKQVMEGTPAHMAYYIRRSTLYQGRMLRFCGMHSEKHLRLFNKKAGRFSEAKVHEKYVTEHPCGTLKHTMIHQPFRDLAHHVEKINNYTTLYAKDKVLKKKVFRLNILFRCFLRFMTIYFVKLAILDGYAGFVWAVMGSYYSFLKYAKIDELKQHVS